MKKLPTITIGIPAHNEESNIRPLLSSILTQSILSAKLVKIIVLSDGSNDHTVEYAKSIKSDFIEVKAGKTRMGKPFVVNRILSTSNTDMVVILDADLVISEDKAIEKLITPLIKDRAIQLTSALALHNVPRNFSEKISLASNQIWEKTIQFPQHNDLYMCSGSIRAFGKSLSREIRFPDFSADDAYAYLECIKRGYKFSHVKDVKIYQKVPTTIKDFINQNIRFIQSQKIQAEIFDKNFVSQFYTVKTWDKIRGATWYFSHNPISTIFYLLIRAWILIISHVRKVNTSSLWTIIKSTKTIT